MSCKYLLFFELGFIAVSKGPQPQEKLATAYIRGSINRKPKSQKTPKLLLSAMILQQMEPEIKNVTLKVKIRRFFWNTRLCVPAAPALWGCQLETRWALSVTPGPAASLTPRVPCHLPSLDCPDVSFHSPALLCVLPVGICTLLAPRPSAPHHVCRALSTPVLVIISVVTWMLPVGLPLSPKPEEISPAFLSGFHQGLWGPGSWRCTDLSPWKHLFRGKCLERPSFVWEHWCWQ